MSLKRKNNQQGDDIVTKKQKSNPEIESQGDEEEQSNNQSAIEKQEDNPFKTPSNVIPTQNNANSQNNQTTQPKQKQRQDNSLSVLTKKFIQRIKDSENHTVDLNETVEVLNVQKRRIYDITNVLEGIGYIEKEHKNKIKWVGGTEDPQLEKEIQEMEKELKDLENQEKEMDTWIDNLHQGLQDSFLKNSEEHNKYTYLTYDDFKTLSKMNQNGNGEALFIITAPKGTTMEVPIIDNETSQEYPHQLFLTSKTDEIQIFICSDENYPMEYQKNPKQDSDQQSSQQQQEEGEQLENQEVDLEEEKQNEQQIEEEIRA